MKSSSEPQLMIKLVEPRGRNAAGSARANFTITVLKRFNYKITVLKRFNYKMNLRGHQHEC